MVCEARSYFGAKELVDDAMATMRSAVDQLVATLQPNATEEDK
jgi:hypothetical protein